MAAKTVFIAAVIAFTMALSWSVDWCGVCHAAPDELTIEEPVVPEVPDEYRHMVGSGLSDREDTDIASGEAHSVNHPREKIDVVVRLPL